MQRQKAAKLHRVLLRWYRREGRVFPWRDTRDPYHILVSEVMLQQTQTARVLEKYPPFLRRFPTIRSLGRARRASVVRAWRGMGYNNRAVRLHAVAGIITRDHSGILPRNSRTLRELPGIGQYTANALLSFAFRKRVPVVETNVRRVLSRILVPLKSLSETLPDAVIWQKAESILPVRRSPDWNQALMDLGATICTARLPRCAACPVHLFCASAFSLSPSHRAPRKQEPSFHGVPDRIHRGRVVDLLRKQNRGISMARLGEHLHHRFGRKDNEWLKKLLRGLERDGLVVTSDRHVRLA